MSLNKWKAWPVEISEDMLKIDKKLVTMKRGSCDQFLAKIKISEPDKAELVSRVLVLVAGLFTFQVPDVSSDANSRNMIRNKAEINLNKWKAWPVENSEDVLKINKNLVTRKRGSRD